MAVLVFRVLLTVKMVTASNVLLDLQGKPTEQSSTLYGAAVSSRAVDGNYDTNFNGNSCTHTSGGEEDKINPWWRVDLQQEASIASVKVYNRG